MVCHNIINLYSLMNAGTFSDTHRIVFVHLLEMLNYNYWAFFVFLRQYLPVCADIFIYEFVVFCSLKQSLWQSVKGYQQNVYAPSAQSGGFLGPVTRDCHSIQKMNLSNMHFKLV